MKTKSIFLSTILAMVLSTNFAQDQNALPTTGDVGIGTATPAAKLDVKGATIIDSTLTVKDSVRIKDRLVVDKDVVFKQDAKIKGTTIVKGDLKAKQKLVVDSTAKFNGKVKFLGIDSLLNSNIDFKILIQKPNGDVVYTNKTTLAQLPYIGEMFDPCSKYSVGDIISNPVWSNGDNKIYANYCGLVNVGIGNNDPQYLLDVSGMINGQRLKIGVITADESALINGFESGNSRDLIQLGVKNSATSNQSDVRFKVTNKGNVYIYNKGGHALVAFNTAGTKILQLEDSGLLRAREIKVDLDNWADYVFGGTHPLMPLDQLADYVKKHQHLPGIPSAKAIALEGLNLGDMQRLQMEKIEELTLYTLEQNQQINALNQSVSELKTENQSLKNQLNALEERLNQLEAKL